MALLKWYGLYQHNTQDGHFMLRVKVVQGVLTGDQAEAIAGDRRDFGRGIVDCTTRQCFQIHWIRLDKVPEIFDRLEPVGLTTSGACGDITRNVVGCTLAGIGHEQIVDGHATAEAVHEYFLGNKLYSNLPRKYKISITGCREDCARGLINDVALSGAIPRTARAASTSASAAACRARRTSRADSTSSSRPRRRRRSSPASPRSSATPTRTAPKRGRARLKFLVDAIGPEGFREELVRRLGRELPRGAPTRAGPAGPRPHRRHAAERRRALARSASACRSAACAPTSCSRSSGCRASTAAARSA